MASWGFTNEFPNAFVMKTESVGLLVFPTGPAGWLKFKYSCWWLETWAEKPLGFSFETLNGVRSGVVWNGG